MVSSLNNLDGQREREKEQPKPAKYVFEPGTDITIQEYLQILNHARVTIEFSKNSYTKLIENNSKLSRHFREE